MAAAYAVQCSNSGIKARTERELEMRMTMEDEKLGQQIKQLQLLGNNEKSSYITKPT
jgi:hypothetical protein